MTFAEKALKAHSPCPQWIMALAEACDEAGKVGPVAARLGRSNSAVSATINGSYTGRLTHIQKDVEAVLIGSHVECPVVGRLNSARCHEIQSRRKLRASDPSAVQFWQACNAPCVHKKGA